MSLLGKRGPEGHNQKEIQTRTRYSDPSQNFLNWVNQLGFEKSPFGRIAFLLDQKFSVRRLSLLFLFSLSLSFLIYFDVDIVGDYTVGEIAQTDIKSPLSLTITDEIATEVARFDAEKDLPIILDYERSAFEPIYNRIYKSFRSMRKLVQQTIWPKSESRREEVVKEFMVYREDFVKEFGVDVPDYVFEWLVDQRFSVRIENILIRAISKWSDELIVDLPDAISSDVDRSAILREISAGGKGAERNMKISELSNMKDTALFDLTGVRGLPQLAPRDQENVLRLARLLLVPNLTLNKQEFADRQKKARDSVLPVQISIKKNQVIVAKGNPIQPLHLTILGHIKRLRSEQRTDYLSLFSSLLFVVLAVVLFSFLRKYSRNRVLVETKDIIVMGATTLFVVVISRLFLFLTEAALLDRFGEMIPSVAFMFAMPMLAAPMIVGLLITSVEVIWVFAVFIAAVTAVLADLNFSVFIVSIIGSIAAAQGIFGCRNRSDIYKAGFFTGFVTALTVLLVYIIQHIGEADLMRGLLWSVSAGFLNGILSSFVAMTFIPAFESIFNYTTDIKLLELSNLTHPLMQEMMMKAPGTYHHSMNVGNMVDAAAKEIGANPLLGKVMAYYHDIGKMEHAQYFIENQRAGYNPHDHISPHMSKTIIIAHVKDGAELAIENKLGKPIVDGILQHHGTTLISFFFNKAIEEQDDDTTGHIEESDFRYPGPKPQFKEAALVMLADSIEATARSLEEPTPGRLNSIVENIIESKFMDGQLDECNLSIRDLAVIKETFKRVLLSMYHQRMDYPHMRDGKPIAQVAAETLTPQEMAMKKAQRK